MERVMQGGCQCGRVRYEARIGDDAAYFCHCGMCRKATGGVAAAFRQVARADVRWTGAEPDRFRSSPIARRGFCSACGTPLTFEYPGSDGMDLTVGSFDDPGFFRPVMHACVETRLEAWTDTGALPGERTEDNEALAARWRTAAEGQDG